MHSWEGPGSCLSFACNRRKEMSLYLNGSVIVLVSWLFAVLDNVYDYWFLRAPRCFNLSS